MPTMSELIELAPWLAAVVIVVSVVVFIATKVVPVVRKFSRFLDDVLGAPRDLAWPDVCRSWSGSPLLSRS